MKRTIIDEILTPVYWLYWFMALGGPSFNEDDILRGAIAHNKSRRTVMKGWL